MINNFLFNFQKKKKFWNEFFLGMQVNFVSNVFFYVFSSQENIFASHELKKKHFIFPEHARLFQHWP